MLAPDPPLARSPAPVEALALHGGQLSAARAAFPDAPEPWIDLSTGINPHAYPVGDLAAEVWRRLPDPAALAALERAARACYRAEPEISIVAAPGTQALIQLLPRLRPVRRVAVLGFGYQEHPDTWRAAGAEVRVAEDLDVLETADVAVVVNPNNPDGRQLAPADLIRLGARMSGRGGMLVVDEAFAEAGRPDMSVVPRLATENVLVLRSFGKFFGLAGLRLGFAIGAPALCIDLRRSLGPWAVPGPAIAIGSRALADTEWQLATRQRLAAEATRLDELLASAGFTIRGGTTLFRLVEHSGAAELFTRLGHAGILVRPFRQKPAWLRFGLPGDEPAWDRLARALRP